MIVAELDQVSKRFGAIVALDEVTFAVATGDVVALLGPNGAGKSTALGVLLGLRTADSGTARLAGLDPRHTAARRNVGVTPQETALPPTLRVHELIDLVRAHYEHPLPAGAVLARFGLDELATRQLGGLSGGERRRVGVALAFAGAPQLVVLDEPTTGLDASSRHAVWDAIHLHAEEGGTILFTTHHLEEADALASRAILIEAGVIVDDGTVAEIKAAAGLTCVSFRAPGQGPIGDAERDGAFARLLTTDAAGAVERLVQAGVPLIELEVRPLTLEEALATRKEAR